MWVNMAALHVLLGTLLLAVNSIAQAPGDDTEQLALRNAEFATSLYRKVAGSNDGNVVVSPLSLTLGLAALAEGAGGQTQEQLLSTLQLSLLQKPDAPDRIPQLLQSLQKDVEKEPSVRYDQGSALFAAQQVSVEATFKERVKEYFQTEAQNVDFSKTQAAANTINDHFRSKTGDKIREAVTDTIDANTQLMLVSAVFFKGQLVLPFNASLTQQERFYIDKYHIAQVPMMFRSDKYHLAYDPALKVGILKLASAGGVAMLVIFPDEDVDITSIDDELYANTYLEWLKSLKRTKLEVQLPRFSLLQSYSLKTALPSMGIPDVFQGNADLSKLSSSQGLKLDEVLQKTAIEIDETGSEPDSAPPTDPFTTNLPPRLTINRPFLFLVYHEATKNLLQIGRVVDPTKN
ncbi:serpin peptidase inhibitor, clade A (alpha-1 antiproteinase, antitrypsin), member 10a isoform X2 [Clupea harengus]|nr:serpin peptidase inhibitor, clade A (alpha-1 antiproteinase, antitrypsin), member 10a isoform X2 [Clupea harengus]XP_012679420.1 serpin peptidase inhibitor, clade A (alpha-1 antiproteinase, antitrypsin), member 10a isoform X2 [Clupea harengus]XP_031437068.1 serpin peptidase inhibitor, clade A (alpha-1 antiproteinase, antitrypsin), member 10a isoform X2 [Clupea harengus]